MLDISSINAVSGIMAAIGVIVGVVFAVLQLRDLVKTRQTELCVSLYSNVIRKEFVEAMLKVNSLEYKDYNDFVKNYSIPYLKIQSTQHSIWLPRTLKESVFS